MNAYQVKTLCRVQLEFILFLSYDHLIMYLCLFCLIYIRLHPITHSGNAIGHSEFSQGDVSGTIINVSPF